MVNVIISSDSRYSINKKSIEETVLNTLNLNSANGDYEVEVCISGDRKMRELNKKYRQIDDTTDVLSFCFSEGTKGFITPPGNLMLGSILISYPQAQQDASEEGKSMEEMINFLVDHGVKHLLGIHHE
jgi:probable rRNA maturation factor